jgi:signal transduction histidine kinase
VIIITGHGTVDTAVQCMKKGAYDFITKPFQLDPFLIVVKRAADKRRLEEKARLFEEERGKNLYDLALEKSRVTTIIHCMGNGVMVTNRKLEVVLHNPALMRLLEISRKMEPPFPVGEILKEEPLLKTLEGIVGGEASQKEATVQEITAGRTVLRAVSAPLVGPEYKVEGTVTVLEDITEFKQLDQMKSDFVNMVAHELRSPLVSIRQIQSVLAEGLAGPLSERQGDFVKRGMKKIDALLALINDLLDVARLEAGRLVRKQTAIDLSALIQDLVLLMQVRAQEQGVELTYSCENMKPVVADPKNIEEVLNNLLTNAIYYSPEGG